MRPLLRRIVARFKLAEQPAGQRKKTRALAQPVNRPKGIDRTVVKEFGDMREGDGDTVINPNRRDIQPKDVFSPAPAVTGVRSLAETGKDLSKAIERDVPKDKGYDVVRNLSQYLIQTDGGSEGDPVKPKS